MCAKSPPEPARLRLSGAACLPGRARVFGFESRGWPAVGQRSDCCWLSPQRRVPVVRRDISAVRLACPARRWSCTLPLAVLASRACRPWPQSRLRPRRGMKPRQPLRATAQHSPPAPLAGAPGGPQRGTARACACGPASGPLARWLREPTAAAAAARASPTLTLPALRSSLPAPSPPPVALCGAQGGAAVSQARRCVPGAGCACAAACATPPSGPLAAAEPRQRKAACAAPPRAAQPSSGRKRNPARRTASTFPIRARSFSPTHPPPSPCPPFWCLPSQSGPELAAPTGFPFIDAKAARQPGADAPGGAAGRALCRAARGGPGVRLCRVGAHGVGPVQPALRRGRAVP